MTQHYFIDNKELTHEYRQVPLHYFDQEIHLTTDRGVFSKGQVDFGSKLLIHTFIEDVNIADNKKIVELGSGYGPIALAFGKYYPKASIIGYEVNERAWILSQENAKNNHIDNVHFTLLDVCHAEMEAGMANYVVTNPPIRAGKRVVQDFIQQAEKLLAVKGAFYVVIQKKQGGASASKLMQQLFGNVEKIKQDKGYWILKSVKL